MRKLIGVAVAGLVMASSTRVDAETRYVTSWFFRVDYLATGQYSDSTDASASGALMMPTGSRWACERKPASLTKSGSVMAGFACWNAAGFVNVVAICGATEAAEDRSAAAVGDTSGGSVLLIAKCKTAATSAPAAPKPIEKSL